MIAADLDVPVAPDQRSSAAERLRVRDQRGFTLLEMLVAVAILATLVSLVPRSFVYARASINRSQSWLEAQLVAEGVLNEELAKRDLRPGTLSGVIDGRSWSAVLTPNAALTAKGADEASAGGGEDDEDDEDSGQKRILLDVVVSVVVSPRDTLVVETVRSGLPG